MILAQAMEAAGLSKIKNSRYFQAFRYSDPQKKGKSRAKVRLPCEMCLLGLLELGDDRRTRQRRVAARHHLILLYRSLGRQREADGHLRALASELSTQLQGVPAASPQARHNANGRPHAGLVS